MLQVGVTVTKNNNQVEFNNAQEQLRLCDALNVPNYALSS